MSEEQKPTSAPPPREAREAEKPRPRKPTKDYRIVYAIRDLGNGKTRWTRIGYAYENRDGSLNLYLDALPLGRRLQIRDAKEDAIGWRPGRFTELPEQLAG